MARRIRILPDHLVNQIAAGEIVERPASVVKELVENSLDAGATRVAVEIWDGGKTEIRVTDDGQGMSREDARLSLGRHATSKIGERVELSAVRSLGFRGEALPAIAAVSRLQLETAETEGAGVRLMVIHGEVVEEEVSDCPVGTAVTVRGLFCNVPERAKFLRSAGAEARAVGEVLTSLALAYPEVTFDLRSDDRELLKLPAVSELRSRVAKLWGDAFAAELMPVAYSASGAALTGLIQRPGSEVPGGRRVHLFVNGRQFTERQVVRAAERAYQASTSTSGRPSLLLFLDLPEGAVDFNVHPAKTEVHFRDQAQVERLVEEGIGAALQPRQAAAMAGSAGSAAGSFHPLALGGNRSAQQMSLFVTSGPEEVDEVPAQAPAELDEGTGMVQPVMWQVHNSYIFAETRGGLVIVDQHSAHERVLYEEVLHEFDAREPIGQRLLFPITLRMSPAEHVVAKEVQGLLSQLGFDLELFGRSLVVHAVPSPHPHFDAERCLREMLTELTEGSSLLGAARSQRERVALSFACKGSIRAGQRLSQQEMSDLFDRLFATAMPYQDIHGRPTLAQLSLEDLHNRFRRSG